MPDRTQISKRVATESGFKFGPDSVGYFRKVHPDLVYLLCHALKYSDVDFGVHDGIHSREEQETLLKKGASASLNSRHIPISRMSGGNDYGHAVHVYPYIVVAGKVRVDWLLLSRVEMAVRYASDATGIPYVWGGKKSGHHMDGQHFELPVEFYPANKPVSLEQTERTEKLLLSMTGEGG